MLEMDKDEMFDYLNGINSKYKIKDQLKIISKEVKEVKAWRKAKFKLDNSYGEESEESHCCGH